MTQVEKIKSILQGSEKSIEEIQAELPEAPRPSIRRVVGEGAKKGIFSRLGKGVYTLTTECGQERAYIEAGKAEEVLPRLISEGRKFDMVFLDPAYYSRALIGGNRGIKQYSFIYADQFADLARSLSMLMKCCDSHVYLMLSGAKTAQNDMQPYIYAMLHAGFTFIAEGRYKKLFANGKAVTNVRGKEAAAERLLLFTISGQYRKGEIDELQMDFEVTRPPVKQSYSTQKSAVFIRRVIQQSTQPGDTVADLFLGSGVTVEESLALGRNVFGIDCSHDAIENNVVPILEKHTELCVCQ